VGILATVAEAVKDLLNDHTFTPVIVAVRQFNPTVDLADEKTLRVFVIPFTSSSELDTLSATDRQDECRVNILIDQAFDPDSASGEPAAYSDPGGLDTLTGLVEDVRDYLIENDLDIGGTGSTQEAVCTDVMAMEDDLFDRMAMETGRQCTAGMTAIYQIMG
jgi:hypothetical protein